MCYNISSSSFTRWLNDRTQGTTYFQTSSSLDTSHSARNLGFIFDEHLTFSDQITSLSNACYYHIRQLRCIPPYLDSSTACTIATSIVHSKLDYCNSLHYKLLKSQLSRLQRIQERHNASQVHAVEEDHARLGWTTSIRGQDSLWKSQLEWQR